MRHPDTALPPAEADPLPTDDPARAASRAFDSRFHAAIAHATQGLSPVSLALAQMDWWLHLCSQPAEAWRLGLRAWEGAWRSWQQSLAPGPVAPADARFAHPGWQAWPWAPLVQAHHASQDWWAEATRLRGMTPHHRDMAAFFARQWLDMLSPSNAGLANPEVLERTWLQGGANLLRGLQAAGDDWRRANGLPPLAQDGPPLRPGVDLALTPGRVVHRNHLAELIQYQPTTATVHAQPVFIVPSWIMKFYILDLSPHNSLVKWLVDQGHTVFILSWRNPDEGDALLGLDDYLQLGVFDALAAIARLVPDQPVQACGYCLGGTLLSIAAAALSRPQRVAGAELLAPIAGVTLLAAETDFSEPGEMGVLIDESQVTLLEDMMAERGFLTGPQMAGSFAFLHARDQVWSRRLRARWLGEPEHANDLMAWNADVTRMPALMHSQYLRRCYLRNELAEGRYQVEDQPVSLGDMRWPMFVVGTERDHVSPWHSVYKIHRLTNTSIRFVLASGGHNAGIVSEPGHAGRHYAMLQHEPSDGWRSPEAWQAAAPRSEGSWWPAWQAWLAEQGGGRRVKARVPPADAALGDAPGPYVQVRYEDPPL
ncbi:PHA/PHB synthase family protein [Aquabacterium sp.]|uniref:PHA/PHB synthase family protein n=1 Tax=Aquabacterium sp. TaxID=1872578 RepID=UPI0037843E05